MNQQIGAITIGVRHRRDMGDLQQLADSIKTEGLLQPPGVTPEGELIFGYRRLVACRDVLGWTEIETRIVNVTSIAAGEYAENEIRKDFTISERVAIMKKIKAELKKWNRHGGDRGNQYTGGKCQVAENYHLPNRTNDVAAKGAGFGNRFTADQAKAVVEKGIPELVEMVDKGEATIPGAEAVARLPKAEQKKIVAQAKGTGTKLRGKARAHSAKETNTPPALAQRQRQPIDRSALFDSEQYWRRQPKPLPPEISGRPVGAAALEQDPDSPPGVTRALAHITKHGMVQTVAPEEHERRRIYDRFIGLNAVLRQLAVGDWPSKTDLDRLDDRRRNLVLEQWERFMPKILKVLDMAI